MKNFILLILLLFLSISTIVISFIADVLIKQRSNIAIAICFIFGNIIAFILWDRFIQLYTDRYANIIIHSTKWAPNFSDANFKEIKKKYSKEDVIRIVGQPLRSFKSGINEEVLVYSDIGSYQTAAEKGYHQRWLVLRDNSVTEIYRRYIRAEANPLKGSIKKKKSIKWPSNNS